MVHACRSSTTCFGSEIGIVDSSPRSKGVTAFTCSMPRWRSTIQRRHSSTSLSTSRGLEELVAIPFDELALPSTQVTTNSSEVYFDFGTLPPLLLSLAPKYLSYSGGFYTASTTGYATFFYRSVEFVTPLSSDEDLVDKDHDSTVQR